jgi:hypothetical protein
LFMRLINCFKSQSGQLFISFFSTFVSQPGHSSVKN